MKESIKFKEKKKKLLTMNRYKITNSDFDLLLQHLIKNKTVSDVLSGVEKKKRYVITPEFINEPEKIVGFPLSQLLVYNYGRTDSASNTMLHTKAGLTKKVAVVGHACDIRALVELDKKLQLKWENLFLISFEDVGYLPVSKMMKFFKKEGIDDSQIVHERLTSSKLIIKLKDGTKKEYSVPEKIDIGENCTRCVQKKHNLADMLISTYALSDDSEEFILTPQSDRAISLIKELNWADKAIKDDLNSKYNEIASNILDACSEKRKKDIEAFKQDPNKLDALAKCTGCGMCVKSCPVCFCVECNLLNQVKSKKMDKLTFVMTRFAHIGDICVECGKCQSNCPPKLPLALIFQSLREKFNANRKYDAGSDLKQKVLHLDVA
jgi:formate dehydrogenase (coenzyme F420) beta subunit